MYAEDTIAAVATPPGPGGVTIIRLSGPLCGAIAGRLFASARPATEWRSHRLYAGTLRDPAGTVLDHALAVLMRRPRSYTGEDVLEFHCHGSPVIVRRVLAQVLACGARMAAPGEFTKRAFLNGRMDLAQAEAVVEMVRASSDAAANLAVEQLSGRLSATIVELREQLVRLKALLEAQIDFSEDDFTVAPDELGAAVERCETTIGQLLSTYAHGKRIREGLRVAIVGKPNVGKSSLLNALLGQDRAIVTPIPGTTRDSIEEAADFDGIPVVLTDTAGLRATAHADAIERLGMQRTTGKIAASQLLLAVFDASQALDAEDDAIRQAAAAAPSIVVLNKIDLGVSLPPADLEALAAAGPVVSVSATEPCGLDDLRAAVVARAGGDTIRDPGPVLTNVRHYAALVKTSESLGMARHSIEEGQPPDLIAVDVQDALDHVGEITGIVTNEAVLDRIFSEFCIGK